MIITVIIALIVQCFRDAQGPGRAVAMSAVPGSGVGHAMLPWRARPWLSRRDEYSLLYLVLAATTSGLRIRQHLLSVEDVADALHPASSHCVMLRQSPLCLLWATPQCRRVVPSLSLLCCGHLTETLGSWYGSTSPRRLLQCSRAMSRPPTTIRLISWMQ